MNNISLVVNTLNEEHNISDCINSASKWVDEIIVCDMYSKDKTVELAQALNARVVYHEYWPGYDVAPARRYAISQASNEWVLVLDADEQLTEALALKLREIVTEGKYEAVSFASLFNYFGGHVRYGGFFNNNWTRFFKKQVYLDTYNSNELIVHQNFSALYKLPDTRRVTLPKDYYILHNAYPTIEKYVNKTIDFYARIEAQQRFGLQRKFRVSFMILDFMRTFFYTYILRKGFLDGTRGLILCFYYSVYVFNIWANIWFLSQEALKSEQHAD